MLSDPGGLLPGTMPPAVEVRLPEHDDIAADDRGELDADWRAQLSSSAARNPAIATTLASPSRTSLGATLL